MNFPGGIRHASTTYDQTCILSDLNGLLELKYVAKGGEDDRTAGMHGSNYENGDFRFVPKTMVSKLNHGNIIWSILNP